MRRFVDLHTHSSLSDGSLSPAELIELADDADLAAVALTDHDTFAGLPEARIAAKNHPRLVLVEGIEISAKWPSGTLHILGLAIDADAGPLRSVIDMLQAARRDRNPKIISKLQVLGLKIDMDDVVAAAGGAGGGGGCDRIIGRLHIAQALQAAGYASNVSDAFAKYLGNDAPAYVDKERLTPARVIAAIHGAGGLAILAHPVQLGCGNNRQLRQVVRDLQSAGLDGLEVYHTDHDPTRTRTYLDLSNELGLAVTGGSDFHGAAKPDAVIGRPRVPLAAMGDCWRKRLLSS